MQPLFIQTQHIIQFVESRGYVLDDPNDPFTYVHKYHSGIIQIDSTIDRIDISLLYEDWKTDGYSNLAEELLRWVQNRPIEY